MAEPGPEIVDITGEPASRVQGAAFYAVRDLRPGQSVALLTAEEPSLLLRSLDLQLGHKLAWSIAGEGGRWRTLIQHRADAPPADVLDLLQREHQRLDGLLARALRLLNTGDAAAATPVMLHFTRTLLRHLYVEDEVLTPFFDTGAGPDEAAAMMLREHAEIAAQLKLIEDCLRETVAGTEDASAYCAILSGTLAKHERREEQNLFPRWRALLAHRREAEGAALLERVRALLAE
jgi:hemerythrin-like domain-containing protein